MFNIGDKVKITAAAVEIEFAEWKGSQVFDNMLKAALEKRFEIVGMDPANYIIKRLEDGVAQRVNKAAAHTQFELATDEVVP